MFTESHGGSLVAECHTRGWSTQPLFWYHGHILTHGVLPFKAKCQEASMLVGFQVATCHQSWACTKGRGASSSWSLLLEECTSLINTIWKALFWLICMRELGKGAFEEEDYGGSCTFHPESSGSCRVPARPHSLGHGQHGNDSVIERYWVPQSGASQKEEI